MIQRVLGEIVKLDVATRVQYALSIKVLCTIKCTRFYVKQLLTPLPTLTEKVLSCGLVDANELIGIELSQK